MYVRNQYILDNYWRVLQRSLIFIHVNVHIRSISIKSTFWELLSPPLFLCHAILLRNSKKRKKKNYKICKSDNQKSHGEVDINQRFPIPIKYMAFPMPCTCFTWPYRSILIENWSWKWDTYVTRVHILIHEHEFLVNYKKCSANVFLPAIGYIVHSCVLCYLFNPLQLLLVVITWYNKCQRNFFLDIIYCSLIGQSSQSFFGCNVF